MVPRRVGSARIRGFLSPTMSVTACPSARRGAAATDEREAHRAIITSATVDAVTACVLAPVVSAVKSTGFTESLATVVMWTAALVVTLAVARLAPAATLDDAAVAGSHPRAPRGLDDRAETHAIFGAFVAGAILHATSRRQVMTVLVGS